MHRYSLRVKLCSIILLVVMLSGCGKLLTRPEVPANVPLAPAVLYVSPCSDIDIESTPSSEDILWETQVCSHVWQALKDRIATYPGRYRLARLHETKPFVADVALEKAIEARYRVKIGLPTKYRHQGLGVIPVHITDVSNNKLLVYVEITVPGLNEGDAKAFAKKLMNGLNGPRCKSEPLFAFIDSNGMKSDIDGCRTFRLPATH